MTTVSTFAFSVRSPQNQVPDAEITKLAASIPGIPSLGEVATDSTYFLNDMKTNSLNTDSWEPMKKLAVLEKQARFEAQKRG